MTEPLHRRSISVESYDEGDTLRVVGRLRDERPWHDEVPVLHDMELELQVRVKDLVITSSTATMHKFPHDECPFISPKFAQLEGLSISRGFTRAMREMFAGVSGCQHLHELARVSGPAVFQAATSLRAKRRVETSGVTDPSSVIGNMIGTCHIWDTDGIGVTKLEMGWRPGTTRYPAPSIEELRNS